MGIGDESPIGKSADRDHERPRRAPDMKRDADTRDGRLRPAEPPAKFLGQAYAPTMWPRDSRLIERVRSHDRGRAGPPDAPFYAHHDRLSRDDLDGELAAIGWSVERRTGGLTWPNVRPDDIAASRQLDPGELLRHVIPGVTDAGNLCAALVGHLDIDPIASCQRSSPQLGSKS